MVLITKSITNQFQRLTRIIQQSTIRITIDQTLLVKKILQATAKVLNIVDQTVIPRLKLIWIVNNQRVGVGPSINTPVVPRADKTVNITVQAGLPQMNIFRVKTAILSVIKGKLSLLHASICVLHHILDLFVGLLD